MKNTKVTIAGVEFKNPVMTASGTFGSGMEYSEFVDLNCPVSYTHLTLPTICSV